MLHPWQRNYPVGVSWDSEIPLGTLPDLIGGAVHQYADRTALEFRERQITYRQLGESIDLAAAAYLRLGIGKGESVGLLLENTPDHPINFFGATKAGARIVHLSPMDGERTLAHKIADSETRTIVTSNLAHLLPVALKFFEDELCDRVIVCDDRLWGDSANVVMPIPEVSGVYSFQEFTRGAMPPTNWPDVYPHDIAALQYTGGTTGLPKGAILTHGNLTAATTIYDIWSAPIRLHRGDAVDKIICVLPLFHIFALVSVLLRQVYRGNHILMHQRFNLEAVVNDIQVKRANNFPGVPTMWIALAGYPELAKCDFSSLHIATSGGAPLPTDVVKILAGQADIQLGGGWGMTETCSAGTSRPKEAVDKIASIGLPLPGIEIDIVSLEDATKILEQGEVGELRVRGPNVTRGYWKQDATAAEAFSDAGFLTGDVGYMDGEGYFYIVDRKKDMIISGGFNVYPQMIEKAIYEHPSVHEVIVVGIPDSYRGESAKAFVKLRPGAAPFSLEELRAFLIGKLGKHEMPTAIEFRSELPKTTVGKLSRHKMRALTLQQTTAEQG